MSTSNVARLAMCAVGLGASVLLGVPAADADAFGPTAYLSAADSPFTGLPFTYSFLENFEDHALDTPGVTVNVGPFVTGSGFSGTVIDSVAGDGPPCPTGTAPNPCDSLFAGGGTVTFTFNAAALGSLPTHAGVVWTDGSGSVTFTAVGPGGPLGTIGPSSGFSDGNFGGGTAEDRFFGFSNPGGILSITITDVSSMEVDHLQYGLLPTVVNPNVPEPATLFLIASGVAGLGLAAWRRHRKS